MIQKIVLAAMVVAIGSSVAFAQEAREKTYPISGATGIELYESIGRNGPKGAIAETRYELTWQRLFDEVSGDCSLVRFRPQLKLTIVLPKPAAKLPVALQRRWQVFVTGVRKHEEEHVRMIRAMVAQTQETVRGAKVIKDPTCAKVKKEVSRRIDEAVAGYKDASREFDRMELSEGGNVHRLILSLVNG